MIEKGLSCDYTIMIVTAVRSETLPPEQRDRGSAPDFHETWDLPWTIIVREPEPGEDRLPLLTSAPCATIAEAKHFANIFCTTIAGERDNRPAWGEERSTAVRTRMASHEQQQAAYRQWEADCEQRHAAAIAAREDT